MSIVSADPAILEARHVHFSYGARSVFAGLNVTVPRGQLVGLLGPNGAGKSTLLHLFLGALAPAQGEVWLHGAPLARLPLRQRARHLAFVPQELGLQVSFSVRDVVALGRYPYLSRFRPLSEVDEQIVTAALAQTDTAAFAERDVTQLSGGERRRVALACALAQQTDILLLDEPLAGLDLAHQLETLTLLTRLAEHTGRTVVASLHDLDLAARTCHHVIVLQQGTPVAEGPPARVLTEDLFARVFRVRAVVDQDAEGRTRVRPLAELT